ncbi:hypothetical protein [Streptomyces sp. ML-6]|uniref:hypothetical protein n=1 Tax=Streptomyces sp. ML-6 TaxID=2982693 RepID=UPI0024BF5E5B|nr:hypothetical protein [Streptomyces sp. ML-6]MDK0520369.1 hypothetical protein [Streptomyces sp. ML-6]
MTTTPEQALAAVVDALATLAHTVADRATTADDTRQALAVEEERTARYSQWLTDIRNACGAPDWPSLADTVRQLRERAEAAESRVRLAHEARRTKIGHLDEVHRALLDTGVIEDGDPYRHADLADVIRQAMTDRAHVEQGDASALRLTHSAAAAWEQRVDRAEQAARRAEATLARIWNARTAADAWAALGMYYGTTPEEAGRRARALRTADERIAEERAETTRQRATDAARSADRYRTAWQSARRRARSADRYRAAWYSARHRARSALAEQQRVRGWLTHWADRARAAEQALAKERATEEPESAGPRQCGHDDYHDAHEWADLPHVWCPGYSLTEEPGR